MSEIRRLLDDLQDTDVVISRLDNELAGCPDEITRLNAESVKRRRLDLVEKLDRELAVQQHDLILYKIVRRAGNYPALAVAKSILAFQELVTAVFDAVRSVPKLRYHPTVENAALSTMDFATARSGSVAVSLYIPSERLLLVESDMDITFSKVFKVLSSRNEEEFRILVDTIGVSSISKAYSWADVSSSFDVDATISWGKTVSDMNTLSVSRDDAVKIKDAIASTKSEEDNNINIDCFLEGLDPSTSYFHVLLNDGQDIKGETAADFPRSDWVLNQYYGAHLTRKKVIKFSTGEEKISWVLNSLSNPTKHA